MADTRKKNVNWHIHTNSDGTTPSSDAHLAVLMDIRDELRDLNRTLGCYRVRRGMDALHSIDRRLSKHMPHRQVKRRRGVKK